jgi:hypothetical protein
MTTERKQQTGNNLAKIISAVFHPLLMPVYGMLIVFSAPTIFGYLPVNVKKILLLIIVINDVLVPLFLMPYFRLRNIISSWTIEDRRERTIPLIATSFFYSVTVYITLKFHIPLFIKSFILASALLVIAVTLINFWWKISIHSVGAGALLALIAILSIKMQTPLPWLLIAAIISAGMVMSSRLWLESHKPGEVWSGFFLGVCGVSLVLLFF